MAEGSSVLLFYSPIIAHFQPSTPGFNLCSDYCRNLFLSCPEFIFWAMLLLNSQLVDPCKLGFLMPLCSICIIVFLIIRVDYL